MDATVDSRSSDSCSYSRAARVTRSLLGYGVLAGPFYVAVVLVQAFIRPGFNLARDDVSLLSNGSLGWIQVANFLLTGAMLLACAVGVRRALPGWGGVLLAVFGLGLVGAAIFVADPMGGFPPGTPAGRPASVSLHGMLHLVSAGVGFLGFAGACFVIGRRLGRQGRRGWAWYSWVTGALFLAGFGGLASGSDSAAVVVAFWIVLLGAWTWLAALSVRLYREVA